MGYNWNMYSLGIPSRRRFQIRHLLVAIATASAAYIAADAYALEMPAHAQAQAAISVTKPTYEVNASDPQRLASVSFTLAGSVQGRVRASLDGGSTWHSCTRSADRITCAADVDSAAASRLRVAAA